MKNLLMKKEKGITLIALVVTIVVLIILAVISVNAIFGEDGIIKRAENSKTMNEKGKVLEALKLAYNSVVIDKLGVKDDATMRDLTIIELEKQGYDIKEVTASTETVTEINLSPETVTLNVGDEDAVVSVTYQAGNTSTSSYYIKINKEYYELIINSKEVSIAEESTDVDNVQTEIKEELKVTSLDTNEEIIKVSTSGNTITITPVAKGETTISVTMGNVTKNCQVTVESGLLAFTINGVEYTFKEGATFNEILNIDTNMYTALNMYCGAEEPQCSECIGRGIIPITSDCCGWYHNTSTGYNAPTHLHYYIAYLAGGSMVTSDMALTIDNLNKIGVGLWNEEHQAWDGGISKLNWYYK